MSTSIRIRFFALNHNLKAQAWSTSSSLACYALLPPSRLPPTPILYKNYLTKATVVMIKVYKTIKISTPPLTGIVAIRWALAPFNIVNKKSSRKEAFNKLQKVNIKASNFIIRLQNSNAISSLRHPILSSFHIIINSTSSQHHNSKQFWLKPLNN